MRRLALAALVPVLGVLLFATLASAARQPVQERVVIDDSFVIPAGEFCDFPVRVREQGKVLVTTHFTRTGALHFISERPNIRITATNTLNGKSVTDRDIGLDKRIFAADGSSRELSTGIHLRTKGPDGKIIFRQIGLRVFTFDADGNLTGVDVRGGNFDPDEAFADTLCGTLT